MSSPGYPPANFQPTAAVPPLSANRRVMKWMLAAAGTLVAAVLFFLILLIVGSEAGLIGLVVGIIMAFLPVPLYVMLALWLDRFESEPPWLLAAAFAWGATVATFMALLLNTLGGLIVSALLGQAAGQIFGSTISAPIVEETGKAAALFILFFWKKDEFDGIVDGVIYATMVALGFATAENILYYGRAVAGNGAISTFALRGIFSPFAHPLFTSMTGVGLGWARQSDNPLVKYVAPVMGLVMAIVLHATWNGSTLGGPLFFLVYIVVMVPALIGALVLVFFSLRREGRIIRELLLRDVQAGVITQADYDQLGSIGGRLGASFKALTGGGVGTWLTQRRFHQTASELAFHRHRTARGIGAQTAGEREAAYLQRLSELRRGRQQ